MIVFNAYFESLMMTVVVLIMHIKCRNAFSGCMWFQYTCII